MMKPRDVTIESKKSTRYIDFDRVKEVKVYLADDRLDIAPIVAISIKQTR